MLLLTKETKTKYIEVHTSSAGEDYYCIEVYDCTPNGKICIKSVDIEKDVFNAITEEE